MVSEENPEPRRAVTVIVQLGNTDNRLKQSQWHGLVLATQAAIEGKADAIHFFGAPPNWDPVQNVAWVFALLPEKMAALRAELIRVRARFNQDAVAWTTGVTEFL